MVVLTVGTCAIVLTAGTAAVGVAAVTGAASGAVAGISGSAPIIAGTIAASGSVGAIAGAAGGTAAAAGTGAVVGVTGAAAGAGTFLGGAGLTAGIASGPLGWLALGTTAAMGEQCATFDCWKPVLHDNSEEPSTGMLLKDLCTHPHISRISYTAGSGSSDLPDIVLENIWDEQFKIEYLFLPETEQMFGHVKRL